MIHKFKNETYNNNNNDINYCLSLLNLIILLFYILTTHIIICCSFFRGRISSSGQIKLSIFGTVYSVCFAVLFFYEAAVSKTECSLQVLVNCYNYGCHSYLFEINYAQSFMFA